jgi:Spy/CpxP family protein refolding chaperone
MRTVALMALLAFAVPLAAQQPQPAQPPRPPRPAQAPQPPETPRPPQPAPGADLFGKYLFPPELIMRHQQEIGLTSAQRDRIRGDIDRAQSTFSDAQWQLSGQSEKLEKLLQVPQIDEASVLAQVDTVLALERRIKRAQIGLLVRIHNTLTEPQRARLTELRAPAD